MPRRQTDSANRDPVAEYLERAPKETLSLRALCILTLREWCKGQRKKIRKIINWMKVSLTNRNPLTPHISWMALRIRASTPSKVTRDSSMWTLRATNDLCCLTSCNLKQAATRTLPTTWMSAILKTPSWARVPWVWILTRLKTTLFLINKYVKLTSKRSFLWSFSQISRHSKGKWKKMNESSKCAWLRSRKRNATWRRSFTKQPSASRDMAEVWLLELPIRSCLKKLESKKNRNLATC